VPSAAPSRRSRSVRSTDRRSDRDATCSSSRTFRLSSSQPSSGRLSSQPSSLPSQPSSRLSSLLSWPQSLLLKGFGRACRRTRTLASVFARADLHDTETCGSPSPSGRFDCAAPDEASLPARWKKRLTLFVRSFFRSSIAYRQFLHEFQNFFLWCHRLGHHFPRPEFACSAW
jgi:hypothetical protein